MITVRRNDLDTFLDTFFAVQQERRRTLKKYAAAYLGLVLLCSGAIALRSSVSSYGLIECAIFFQLGLIFSQLLEIRRFDKEIECNKLSIETQRDVRSIFGTWPGDETDAELQTALRAID